MLVHTVPASHRVPNNLARRRQRYSVVAGAGVVCSCRGSSGMGTSADTGVTEAASEMGSVQVVFFLCCAWFVVVSGFCCSIQLRFINKLLFFGSIGGGTGTGRPGAGRFHAMSGDSASVRRRCANISGDRFLWYTYGKSTDACGRRRKNIGRQLQTSRMARWRRAGRHRIRG